MRFRDLLAVLPIERACFRNPWGLSAFVAELVNPRSRPLVVRDPAVIAYAILWLQPPEAHLGNLAVHPSARRRGLGRLLVDEVLAVATAAGAAQLFLEVRPSNVAARHLYQGSGFEQVGRRAGYYSDDGEDALVLRRALDREEPGT